VSRSLSACEGALLVVDAAQGVEAQTVANVHLAIKQNLTIIPIINKIDLPHADVALTRQQLEDILAIPADTAILASAKEGIGIDDIGGASYGKAQVEWVLPPLRFRRAGIPSVYLQWAQLSLFATGLVTDVDDRAARRTLASAGVQLDCRLVTLSHLESTLSIGFAVAHEAGAPLHSAGMFSFKIM